MCKKNKSKKTAKVHTTPNRPDPRESYDYLVDKAVERGESTIFYQGRTISIM